MKSMGLEGWVNVVYFPPNNWEYLDWNPKYLYLIYSNGSKWRTVFLKKIYYNESVNYSTKDFEKIFSETSLGLIYPSPELLEAELNFLPVHKTWKTHTPAWRATSGFKQGSAQVSYQSDLEPLPDKGSLLTFHPFIQFGQLKNYLIVLNAESTPSKRISQLLVFNCKTKKLICKTNIQSNSVTTLDLDSFNFSKTDLPIFISTKMAAVPFGLGISSDSRFMSLEHTHPPGSFVVRGDRNKVQKMIKSKWFEALEVSQYEN